MTQITAWPCWSITVMTMIMAYLLSLMWISALTIMTVVVSEDEGKDDPVHKCHHGRNAHHGPIVTSHHGYNHHHGQTVKPLDV